MTGLLIAGTSSDAGKSLITAGLCRILARRGVSVAPFKSQNMSNNSAVCPDGSEISRAQYLQAIAARVEPESAMNPVLLNRAPTDVRIVLRGEPAGALEAGEYATGRDRLRRARSPPSWPEGSTSCSAGAVPRRDQPPGRRLRQLRLARRFDLPVVLCGDIDRGGAGRRLRNLGDSRPRDRASGRLPISKFRGDESVSPPA